MAAVRSRKLHAAWDNTNLQTTRMNMANDKFKPKQIPEDRVRSQEAKTLNLECKPNQSAKFMQRMKVLHKGMNHQAPKIAEKPGFKQPMKRTVVGIKKMAAQKKIAQVANVAQKNKPSVLADAATVKPKVKKVPQTPKIQAQVAKFQKIVASQKTHPENVVVASKNPVQQDDIPTARKTPSNTVQPPKTQENVVNDTANTKPAEDIPPAHNTNAVSPVKKDEEPKVVQEAATDSTEKMVENVEEEAPAVKKAELSELLARAVEEELQDIMIQVWQQLPDDPPEEGERLAVEMLRNEAGDDLRRVLGLNITKRLLNVYNNLFIKINFTCRPQMGCLTKFLHENKIEKFKRIDSKSNTFAAQMNTIEDFDKICEIGELMCGEAKVTVAPCYKFTQCPKNLKTIYDETYFYEDAAQVNIEPQISKNYVTKPKVIDSNELGTKPKVIAPNQNATKLVEKTSNAEEKSDLQNPNNSVSNENLSEGNIEIKCDTQKTTVITANKNITKSVTKEETEAKLKEIPDRTNIQKTDKALSNSCEEGRKDLQTFVEEKTIDSSKTVAKEVKSNVKRLTGNNTTYQNISKDVYKDICTKAIEDILISGDDDDELGIGIPENQMEDDEELDDQDILALMSEGVVLDECSASEDEK